MNALEKAVDAAGGYSALARSLGIAASTPQMWKARGSVPAEWCPAIEEITGVRCEELRPDVRWHVLRRRPRKAA